MNPSTVVFFFWCFSMPRLITNFRLLQRRCTLIWSCDTFELRIQLLLALSRYFCASVCLFFMLLCCGSQTSFVLVFSYFSISKGIFVTSLKLSELSLRESVRIYTKYLIDIMIVINLSQGISFRITSFSPFFI